jgi:hypothetical protein
MKLTRLSLAGCIALAVSSCVGPDGQMMPMGDLSSLSSGFGTGGYDPPPSYGYDQGGYPPPQQANAYPQQAASAPSSSPWSSARPQVAPPPLQSSGRPVQQSTRPTPPPTSDYLPLQRDEYRSGYDIGAKDRSLGYLSDPKRAYTRFGRGAESYFNEGYSDGFNGTPIRH